MTHEWQEATNQRLKELGIEPISGPGSEDYQVSLLDYKLSDIPGQRCYLWRLCQSEKSCCCA